MPKQKSFVGSLSFDSKQSLYEHCRSIVAKYGDGELMRREDAEFFLMLVQERHRTPEHKLIPGLEHSIEGVVVRHESAARLLDRGGKNHTVIRYASGDEVSFSWVKCCRGFSRMTDVNGAMRRAVFPQVIGFKKFRFVNGSVSCEETGEALQWDTAAVDHYPKTFASIRDDWLVESRIGTEGVCIERHPKGGSYMVDEEQLKSWEQFHAAEAVLRLVTVEVNKTSWVKAKGVA